MLTQGGAKASSTWASASRHYEDKTSGLLGIYRHDSKLSKTFDLCPVVDLSMAMELPKRKCALHSPFASRARTGL